MKSNITGKDLSFQYRLRRLISLKRTIAVNLLLSNKNSQKKKMYIQSAGQSVM